MNKRPPRRPTCPKSARTTSSLASPTFSLTPTHPKPAPATVVSPFSLLRFRRSVIALPTLLVFLLLPTANAAAQEEGGVLKVIGGLFGGNNRDVADEVVVPAAVAAKPIAVIKNNVGADFANMYTPFIAKVLTAELHFVKKVCRPTEKQFDEIHRSGLLATARLSKHYEDLQRIRQTANQWPKPRRQITAALQEQVDKMMPADVAEQYRQELAARLAAEREAAAGTMLIHIDAAVLLTPDQHDELSETLQGKWNNAWSSGPRLFMYPQYARMPESHVLRPHLSERQRSLWSQRNSNTSVNFGWQMELGLQDWFGGGVELKAFDKPGPADGSGGKQAGEEDSQKKVEA